MSEIRIECPHCGQHLACDDAHGGSQIDCPACRGSMLVPVFAFGNQPAGGQSPRPMDADARGRRLYPVPPSFELWTEEAWNRHTARLREEGPLIWPLVVLVLLSPALVGLATVTIGGLVLDKENQALLLMFLFMLSIALSSWGCLWLADHFGVGPFLGHVFVIAMIAVNLIVLGLGCARTMQ